MKGACMSKKKENGAARYYSRLGYSLGYNLVLGRSQHAGYWWEGTKNEREAQQSFLEEFAKLLNLQSSERVLDAGSGQDVMACYLAEKTGAKLIGATITPREVRVSNKLSKGMKNALKFVIGDYMNTDFPWTITLTQCMLMKPTGLTMRCRRIIDRDDLIGRLPGLSRDQSLRHIVLMRL